MSYTLVDAEERSSKNPVNFYIPQKLERENLSIGSLVKLIFNDIERMWVKVTEIKTSQNVISYVGTLVNKPFIVKDLNFGDEIVFEPKHVINIGE